MRYPSIFSASLGILLVLLMDIIAVRGAGPVVDLEVNQPDVQIIGKSSVGIGIATATTGDLNGDGVDDLILASQMLNNVSVLFGKKVYPKLLPFSKTESPNVHFTSTANNFLIYPPLQVADLSNDGIGDLFLPHATGLNVYWGRSHWPTSIDATTFPIDLRIIAEAKVDPEHKQAFSLVVTGDVNNDGMLDLLFTHTAPPPPKEKTWDSQLQKVGWLFWGRKQWPAVIDLTKEKADVVIWAKQPPPRAGHVRQLDLADLNGDGFDDIVVGGWYYMTGAFAYRKQGPWHSGWIIPGGPHIPPKVVLQDDVLDLFSKSSKASHSLPVIRMAPLELGKVFGAGFATGDVTGDGIKDLVLPLFSKREKTSKQMPQRLCLLPGQDNLFAKVRDNALRRCQLIFGSPGFEQGNPFPSRPPVLGDFNGDRRDDIFLLLGFPEHAIKGLLGQPFPKQAIDIKLHPTVTMHIPDPEDLIGPFASFMNMGDINGDGCEDLLIVEPLGGRDSRKDIGPGSLHVVFGRDNPTKTGFKIKANSKP